MMYLMDRKSLLVDKKDYKALYQTIAELSEAIAELSKDEDATQGAIQQSWLAWQILVDERLEVRDLNLAEKIATRANEAAEGKDPAVLDTLARALFMNQKQDKAIEIQRRAVELGTGKIKDGLQATLDSYIKGQLPTPDPRSSRKLPEW